MFANKQCIKKITLPNLLYIFVLFSFAYVLIYSDASFSLHQKLTQKLFRPMVSKIDINKHTDFIYICQNKVTYKGDVAIWTFLTDDFNNYAQGSIKLLKSIRLNVQNTDYDSIMLELIEKPFSVEQRKNILNAGWKICQVNRIVPRDDQGTYPRFRDQFTKLLLWNVTEYKANFYFDSDTFVIRNIDEFLRVYTKFDVAKHKLGCTKDIRASVWQDSFNMGVFVVRPNTTEFIRLLKAKSDPNVKFETTMSEQGFLNVVYKDLWYEIGFENNANLAVYSQKRDFWESRQNAINVIHYTMNKPWSCSDEYKEPCDKWRAFNESS